MKKFRFTMGTLILAMMATAFFACNKEKGSSVVQQTTGTEDVVRKPIATTDLKTGVTTFTYSIEEYQSFLDRITQNRKEGSEVGGAIHVFQQGLILNAKQSYLLTILGGKS